MFGERLSRLGDQGDPDESRCPHDALHERTTCSHQVGGDKPPGCGPPTSADTASLRSAMPWWSERWVGWGPLSHELVPGTGMDSTMSTPRPEKPLRRHWPAPGAPGGGRVGGVGPLQRYSARRRLRGFNDAFSARPRHAPHGGELTDRGTLLRTSSSSILTPDTWTLGPSRPQIARPRSAAMAAQGPPGQFLVFSEPCSGYLLGLVYV